MARTRTRFGLAVAIAALAVAVGCTLKDQSLPGFVGPSELGLSLTVSVYPDTLTMDGASRAVITIVARDGRGQAVANVSLRLDSALPDSTHPEGWRIIDFGTLSTRNTTTASDGRATVTYTAPVQSEPVDNGEGVYIIVRPIGADYANTQFRRATIRLLPSGIILPPNQPPVPSFTWSQPATEKTPITFDASSSTDPDGTIVTYAWEFGDGTTGTGVKVNHTYQTGGTYSVRLTVTDDRGTSVSSDPQTVAVATIADPTASFDFSPAAPLVNEPVFFNAAKSQPAPGRTITSYSWNFGDGTTGSGVTVQKTYGTAGTYTVTLTVTDDLGRQGTTSKTVAPAESTPPTADFDFSPTAPATGQAIFFTAAKSKAATGRRIVSYDWNFGAGTSGSGMNVEKTYDTPGTYVVTLTVTDDVGKKGTTSKTVAVTTGGSGGVRASFTFSPSDPQPNDLVTFNATESSSPAGIVKYRWDWGDGTFDEYGSNAPIAQHKFTPERTYVVRLTVTDAAGKTATITKDVVVSS